MPAPDNRTFPYQQGAKRGGKSGSVIPLFCVQQNYHCTCRVIRWLRVREWLCKWHYAILATDLPPPKDLFGVKEAFPTQRCFNKSKGFTWQTNGVVLPFWLADLGSTHYLQLCPDFFHWHCFCGMPPFKTAQLPIVSERMSSACGIICPSHPSELGSKQSTFHTGYVSLNAHQDPFLGSA